MLGWLGLCPDRSPFGLLELDRIRHAENEHIEKQEVIRHLQRIGKLPLI